MTLSELEAQLKMLDIMKKNICGCELCAKGRQFFSSIENQIRYSIKRKVLEERENKNKK